MKSPLFRLLVFTAGLSSLMACGGIPTTETPEESPTATNSEPETRAADPAAVSQMPAQAIATTALTSEPIRMTADDLP